MSSGGALPGEPGVHLPSLARTARHLRRYREVAEVLVRHGLGVLLGTADLAHLVPRRMRGRLQEGPVVPVHLRRALEELGATFIKLGQVLSLRADLLPGEFVHELARLQDQVPPGPFAESRRIIESELGAPLDRLFAFVEPKPLAAASLSQVYAALLPSGQPVVLKVLRPGVEQQVATDLEILEQMARLLRERLAGLQVDPVALVQEFARVMRRELDLRAEARHIQRFRRNFRGDRRIHIPRVYEHLTTARVLTMERLRGVKVTDLAALDRLGVDRRRLARTGARLFLKMVMEDRFFHGDPHPGNLLVEPDGRLAVLDYGMVGTLAAETAEHLISTFVAVVRRDPRAAVRGMERMGIVPPGCDRESLRRDLGEIIEQHYGRPLAELTLRELVDDALGVVRRHRLVLPSELLVLARALVLLDGLGRQLDPAFNPLEVAMPYARRLLASRLHPRATLQRLRSQWVDAWEMARALPARADRLLGELESGRLAVGFRLVEAERQIRRLERSANRVALALLAAGLSVTGALLWLAPVQPRVPGWAAMAFLASGSGVILTVLLIWGIWRSGRL